MTVKTKFAFGLIASAALLAGCTTPENHSAKNQVREPASTRLAPEDVIVIGGDAGGFTPDPLPENQAIVKNYDVVIVGGGLAGLSSAVYLTDAGKKVLLVEKENHLGGLAASTNEKTKTGRGAAYWTDAYEEEQKILNHIGLKDFMKKNPIPEPIDSYYVRDQYYSGIWEDATVAKLPASFALFKSELLNADATHKIPNQPFEESTKYGYTVTLDQWTALEWIEAMPAAFEERIGKTASKEDRAILARFKAEMEAGKLIGRTGMQGVVELMDLYCRSALGSTSDKVNAMAFANFYISEITTRYTSNEGTGEAADKMVKMLSKRTKLFTGLKNATVSHLGNTADGVDVHFNYQDKGNVVHAKYAVFAGQLKVAPKLIDGLNEKAPEKVAAINSIDYSHYAVHVIHTDGNPYRATYDTWVRATDYSEDDFTDVILGRWMDPTILGYKGYRDFKKNPPGDGVFTIYQGLASKWSDKDFSETEAKQIAVKAVDRMEQLFTQLPKTIWKGSLSIKKVETNRWPYSVHVPTPGYYTTKARILRHPFGNIYFANNNIGTPAFEEALFRGHCAATNILKHLSSKFRPEKWTRCPLE